MRIQEVYPFHVILVVLAVCIAVIVSRVYLKGLVTSTCERMYCLKYFALNSEKENDIDNSNSHDLSNLTCDKTYPCGFCPYCLNCIKQCESLSD